MFEVLGEDMVGQVRNIFDDETSTIGCPTDCIVVGGVLSL